MGISMIVLLVLGVLILIAVVLAFTMGWEKFLDAIRGYSGSDMQNAIRLCESECNLNSEYDFCCGKKEINTNKQTCPELNISCEINCQETTCLGE